MGKIIKPGIILFLVCFVAAGLLGYVYEVTKAPIAAQEVKIRNDSMRAVLPSATDFKDETSISDPTIKSVTTGSKDGKVVGYVIVTNPKGYSGHFDTFVGVDVNGKITGVEPQVSNETPGLGANASKPDFKSQYLGKSGDLKVTKSGTPKDNEIEAMTSATITSSAVTRGVNSATNYFAASLKGGK